MTINEPATARKSWPRRHKILTALGVLATFITIITVAGALAGTGSPGHPVATASSQAAATTTPAAAAAAPAPAPSPGGTYQGSCDYTLAADPSANDHLVAEVDLTNTGNIGTIDRVRVTWPQEGYPPITARRTVRVAAGTELPVRFHVSAGSIAGGSNVIDLLQSWQDNHGMRDGCTYHAAIAGTYGQVHG